MSLKLQSNRFLSEFSTFGIGGPIRRFAEIVSEEEMEEAFAFLRKEQMPFLVLGKGSNCLFSDRGFEGLVLLNKIQFCKWRESTVQVGAGYSFSLLGAQAGRKNLSGLEFASGIPASVGGALFMNAGANGRETCDPLVSVDYLHVSGQRKNYMRSELEFRYRTSPFQSMQGAILGATFEFMPLKEARKIQRDILERRMKTQPLKDKSAGCIFRNPSSRIAAAKLIEQCGLKGKTIGGAKVSETHANFIVNEQKAKASDVLALIRQIQETVAKETGIQLETEVRIFS